MGFSRQEYWSGLPFPPPGDPPDPGTEPASLALPGRFFTTYHLGSPKSKIKRFFKKKKKQVWLCPNKTLFVHTNNPGVAAYPTPELELKSFFLYTKKLMPREVKIFGKGHSLPGGSAVKNLLANAGDQGSIYALGRSPGEGNGNPLQYSCLRNPMDRGAWRAIVHGVTKSQTRLSG